MAAQSTFSVYNHGTADIALPGQTSALSGANAWTFSFWFKAPSTQTFPNRLAEKGANSEWEIHWADATTITAVVVGQGSAGTSGNVADNVWHHVAFTNDPAFPSFGQVKFYVDGALIGSFNGSPSPGVGDFVMLRFGGGGLFSDVLVDDIAVIGSVLSLAQIAAIAGTVGVVGSSTLNVASLSPSGLWRLETGSGLTAFDTGSGGNNGTMGATMTWSTDVPPPLSAATAASSSSVAPSPSPSARPASPSPSAQPPSPSPSARPSVAPSASPSPSATSVVPALPAGRGTILRSTIIIGAV